MSQHSEERVSDEATSASTSARVLQFERPQSELQRAVQQRAQETIDRARDRAAAQRLSPWGRALVLALAVIPVVLTFGAAISFVGALRQFNAAVFGSASSAQQEQAPAPATEANKDSDVVMLQPYGVAPAPAEKEARSSTGTPAP